MPFLGQMCFSQHSYKWMQKITPKLNSSTWVKPGDYSMSDFKTLNHWGLNYHNGNCKMSQPQPLSCPHSAALFSPLLRIDLLIHIANKETSLGRNLQTAKSLNDWLQSTWALLLAWRVKAKPEPWWTTHHDHRVTAPQSMVCNFKTQMKTLMRRCPDKWVCGY